MKLSCCIGFMTSIFYDLPSPSRKTIKNIICDRKTSFMFSLICRCVVQTVISFYETSSKNNGINTTVFHHFLKLIKKYFATITICHYKSYKRANFHHINPQRRTEFVELAQSFRFQYLW